MCRYNFSASSNLPLRCARIAFDRTALVSTSSPKSGSSYASAGFTTPQGLLDAIGQPAAPFLDLARRAEVFWCQANNIDWLIPWALALWRASEYTAALEVLERGSGQLDSSVDYLSLKGMVLRRLPGRKYEAFAAYKAAIAIAPFRADIYFNMGNILREDLQSFELAVKAYQFSLQLDPYSPKVWLNYAISLQEIDRLDESSYAHSIGLCLEPSNADAWNNAGLCALANNRIDKALRFFLYSISLDRSSSAACINAGNALVELLSPQDALSYLDRAIQLEGGSNASANALFNTSLVRLLLGEYRIGWKLYESRFNTKQFESTTIPSSGPRILNYSDLPDTNALPGQELLVWSEQGLGDSIQFCRYLLILKQFGIPFVYQTRDSLLPLMRDWLGLGASVISSDSQEFPDESRPHIPLLSLPHLFETDLHTIPSLNCYLRNDASPPKSLLVESPPGGISVGVVWASNPDNKAMYRKKSIPLSLLMPRFLDLMNLDLIQLHSLQVGEDSNQISPWIDHPRLTNWDGKLNDFSDTAHVVQQLDLLICVDTAVAHLAGALDRPTWLLLPANADFRWLQDRTDSPWYSSMRLFRQKQRNDWISVVREVHKSLDKLFLLNIDSLVSSRSLTQLNQAS